ncbi:LINC01115 isoform 3 [Pongo abelii]|uniref:LINC01115 isoform 3 n=1 Tax=Pongo abelii TaxID=9601 RepID=A0A2J8SHC5_PONAB|nr:LINC01115 isoform 3 [Pongo abelii]
MQAAAFRFVPKQRATDRRGSCSCSILRVLEKVLMTENITQKGQASQVSSSMDFCKLSTFVGQEWGPQREYPSCCSCRPSISTASSWLWNTQLWKRAICLLCFLFF